MLNFRGVEAINMDNMDKNAFDVFPNLDFMYVVINVHIVIFLPLSENEKLKFSLLIRVSSYIR